MKKLSVSIVAFIAITSILFSYSFIVDKLFEPDYEKIADAITAKTAQKIRKEKGLIPIGTGGGMMEDIEMMAISFNYYKEVDFDTARRFVVYCVEEYLTAINSSEKVRPYLHNYPFTAKNVEIRIFFYKPDRRDPPLGSITVASSIAGNVRYKANNPNGYTLDTLREETYEEALKIVTAEGDK
jgi:hypothetical protein